MYVTNSRWRQMVSFGIGSVEPLISITRDLAKLILDH